MATQSESPFNRTAGGTIAAYRLLKLSGATVVHNTATASDEPIGVSQAAYSSGDTCALRDIKHGGTHKVTAAGAISAGAKIYAAAAGKAQALPAGAGTYREVGRALEAATADGDIIEAHLKDSGETDVVSGS